MNIGIVGYGVVGDALAYALKEKGFSEELSIIDPVKSPTKFEALSSAEMVFLCVPTPSLENGTQDLSIINRVCGDLQNTLNYRGIVVVKSTTTPLGIFYLVDRWHRLKFVANPEFLTQRQARVDFVRSPLIILGGTTPEVTVVEAFYRQYWPDSKYLILSAPGAMMVKYMLNTFFATKVIFLNEMYQLWKRLNLKDNWESLIEGFVSDSRVGTSHSSVPGPDGDFGFGGACFPKDLRAITQDAIFIGSEHEVLEAVWRANTILRQVEDWK